LIGMNRFHPALFLASPGRTGLRHQDPECCPPGPGDGPCCRCGRPSIGRGSGPLAGPDRLKPGRSKGSTRRRSVVLTGSSWASPASWRKDARRGQPNRVTPPPNSPMLPQLPQHKKPISSLPQPAPCRLGWTANIPDRGPNTPRRCSGQSPPSSAGVIVRQSPHPQQKLCSTPARTCASAGAQPTPQSTEPLSSADQSPSHSSRNERKLRWRGQDPN